VAAAVQEPRLPPAWTHKPCGLWVSVGDAWERWCRHHHWRLERLTVKQRIVLKALEGKMLLLNTARAVEDFQAQYEMQPPAITVNLVVIDWPRVVRDYAGIVIAPYQPTLRHRFMWYYFWDCASGCIWDTSIIDSVLVTPR
jgi:hypothetical protein